jgi:uncharacterized protein (TIGR03067 family)
MRRTAILSLGVLFLLLASAGADDKNKNKDKLDPEKLIGTWTFVSGEKNGAKIDAEGLKKGSVVFAKDKLTLKSPDGDFIMKYTIDTKKAPAEISLEITEGPQGQGAKATGIISLKDDELKLAYPAMGGDTPKEFASKEGSGVNYFVLKRKK